MQALLHVFDIGLPLAYAAVFAAYLHQFFKEDQEGAWPRRMLAAVVVAHVLYFVLRGAHLGFMPLATQEEFLSLVALSIAGVYGFIDRTQGQSRTGAFFIAPAVVAQSIASVFIGYGTKHPILLENPVYGIHAILLVFGFSALAIGTLYAVMYLLMSRQLKARELGMFFKRLPPLMMLERMSRLGTLTGVCLLGFGLAVGYLLALSVPEVDLSSPKIIVTDVVLAGYVVGVLVSRIRGLSGVQVAWATMIWFTVFLLSVGMAPHSFA